MTHSRPVDPAGINRYSVSLQQTAAALFGPVGQQGGDPKTDTVPRSAGSPDKAKPVGGQMR